MRRNRSVPPVTVVPILVYPDVRAAAEWLTTTFGFVERTRIGESHRAQTAIGTDRAMIVADVGERRAPHANAVTRPTRSGCASRTSTPTSSGPVLRGPGYWSRQPTGSTASGTARSKTSPGTDGSSARRCETSHPKSTGAKRCRTGPNSDAAPLVESAVAGPSESVPKVSPAVEYLGTTIADSDVE